MEGYHPVLVMRRKTDRWKGQQQSHAGPGGWCKHNLFTLHSCGLLGTWSLVLLLWVRSPTFTIWTADLPPLSTGRRSSGGQIKSGLGLEPHLVRAKIPVCVLGG